MREFVYRSIQILKIQILLLIIIPAHIYSQDVDFEGYGAVGYQWINRNTIKEYNQLAYYEGKLQAEIDISDDLEAQLDFRGNQEGAYFREFSAKFKYWKRMKLKVGNVRQNFGLEQLINKEDYEFIERSYINDNLSELGYAPRAVSINLYAEYKKDDKDFKDFPYSYFVSVFKNNSLQYGIVTRGSYHTENFSYSLDYAHVFTGGQYPVNSPGVGGDVLYVNGDFRASIEGFYVGNTERILQKEAVGLDDKIYAAAGKVVSAVNLKLGGKVLKSIEPILLVGYYAPDVSEMSEHTIQTMTGANVYFNKDFRLRVQGNLLLSKGRYNTKYSATDSRFTVELQITY